MSVNVAYLIGRVGKDPEVRRLESGNIFANTSLATSEKYKDKTGEMREETQWHNLVFFGRTAELVEQYVHKGDMIYVQGKIAYRQYEKDGATKYITEIKVTSIQFLGGKKDQAEQSRREEPDPHGGEVPPEGAGVPSGEEDALPF